jgi:hypothetical protein
MHRSRDKGRYREMGGNLLEMYQGIGSVFGRHANALEDKPGGMTWIGVIA